MSYKKSIFINEEEFNLEEEEIIELDQSEVEPEIVEFPHDIKPGTEDMLREIRGEKKPVPLKYLPDIMEEAPWERPERPLDLSELTNCPRCQTPLRRAIAINGSESMSFNECPACGTLVNTFKPIKYQAEVAERTELYIMLAGGFGCHDPEAKILMYSGCIKEARDIKEGDLLMGPDSKPRKVLEIHKGMQPRYAVHIKNARVPQTPLYFNEDHIMHLEYYNYKEGYHAHGHHSYDGQYSNPTIKEYMSKSKRYKSNHMWVFSGPLELPEQSVPVDPYTFGLYLGDGCVTKKEKIALTSNDHVIIDYLKTVGAKYGLELSEYTKQGTTAKSLVFKRKERIKGSNEFQNDMERTGIIGCDSHSKFIPDIYMFNNLDNRRKLLAGILDTNGYHVSGTFDITLASEQLTKDIKYVAQTLGIRVTYRHKLVNGKTYYRLTLRGPEISNIPTLLKRKQAINKPNKRHYLQRFKVEKVSDDAEYVGFTVDQDSLYVEGEHFTIIHNSGKSRVDIEKIISHLILIANARVVVSAKTYPAIEATFVKDFFAIMPKRLLRKKNEMKHEWVFTNGSELLLRSFDDPVKLRGINATMFVLLEASNIMYEGFELAQNRIRNTAALLPKFDSRGMPVFKYDEKSKSMRPVYAHDARKILIETNPDAGWVKKKFLVDSGTVSYYGSAHREGYRMNLKTDPNKFSLVMATDANPYLPENYIEEQTRGKSEAYIKQFFYGSFNFSDGLVYPNVGARIVQPHPLPPEFDEQGRRALWYLIGLDYGVNDALAIIYAAFSTITRKIYFFDELYERNLDVKTAVRKHREKMKLHKITNNKLMMLPLFDGRSYNKREANLQTIGSLFNAEGLYFTPSFTYNDARNAKLNGIINEGQIEIYSNLDFYIEEVTNYKWKVNKDGTTSDSPVDKNNHAINAGEFIIMALPVNLNYFDMSAYLPPGTLHLHDTDETKQNKEAAQVYNPYQGGSSNVHRGITYSTNNRYGGGSRPASTQPAGTKEDEDSHNIFQAYIPRRSK